MFLLALLACPPPVLDSGEDSEIEIEADADTDTDADSDADTDPVTYDGDIAPVFATNCTDYGCHLNRESINSLDASVAYGFLTTEMSEDIPTMPKVDPGDSSNSYLYLKLKGTHLEAGGAGVQMPKGQDPLSADDLALVKAWIDGGAVEN